MRVLDLFCGLGGWGKPFRDAGHEVMGLDINPRFEPDLMMDVSYFNPYADEFDVVLASPPCESFSVASIGTHWGGGKGAYIPKTDAAYLGMVLVNETLRIINTINPRIAIVENPRGVLRKLNLLSVEPQTVWYCHYGERRAKPTDLWVVRQEADSPLSLRPACHNQRADHPQDCCCRDHDAAPRGARTGTQGISNYAERSLIPFELADSVRRYAEGVEGR